MIWAIMLAIAVPTKGNPHGPNLMVKPDNDRDYANLVAFASCLITKYPDRARRYLESFPFVGDQNKLVNEAIPTQCLKSGTLRVSPVQLRGAIAREFLLREYPQPISSFVQAKSIELGDTISADDPELKGNFVSLYKTAECVARDAPNEVDTLVRKSHSDEREVQAYRQLLPVWSSCKPRDFFVNPTIYSLKAVESEMLYRLLKASDGHLTISNADHNHA